MGLRNFEFKAKVKSLDFYEEKLMMKNPDYIGEDHQVDTYFDANKGRLKLREGTIENALIEYFRENSSEAKASSIRLFKHKPAPGLKEILTNQLGVKVVVDKKRKIYFIDHIKFHFDKVKGLGTFIEVEVIDETGEQSLSDLEQTCQDYFEFFELSREQLQSHSYSDLLMQKQNNTFNFK